MGKNFMNPPVTLNPEGKERSVGVEFEFSGVDMQKSARIITGLYGGELNEINTYKYEIQGTHLGPFTLELDASLFLNKEYEDKLNEFGIDVSKMQKKQEIEEKLRDLASSVVPFEIVSPPVPLSQLKELNPLIHELRKAKAKGTKSSVLNAFGLHLNPEIPSTKATNLLRYIQAFILIEPWIRQEAEIDWSRRMTPYISEYNKEYKRRVLDKEYDPSLEELITDYIEYGNTRNQSLDMLPAFQYLDEELVSSILDDGLTTARPTFHYRLPNCEIANDEWSLATEWNRWVMVERMAEEEQLNQYAARYISMMLKPMISKEKKWIELIERWMEKHEQ